jgi:protein-S-isoprenylcysteine O-methyltransferase Ste14
MAGIATSACWGLVIVTWIVAAAYWGRKAPGKHQGGAGTEAAWRIGAVIAAAVVYVPARGDLHRVSDHARWLELLGLALLVVSAAFAIWARLTLGRMWSASPDVLRSGHRLQTDGPYAITRHPIYTGLLGMLIGTVLLNGVGASLVLLAAGAVVLATRIPIEERLMSRTFPDEYAQYRKRVPALLPGLQLIRGARRT